MDKSCENVPDADAVKCRSQRKGILLVLIAGISWGLMSILVRGMDKAGLQPFDIAALRAIGTAAALGIAFSLFNRKAWKVRIRDLWCMAGCGILSITCFNICYFAAITRTTVNIAVVLLYTSPVFVALMAALFFKEKFTIRKLLALFLVISGCCLVSGISASGAGANLSFPVLVLGLGSGFCYALYTIFGRCAQNRGYSSSAITLWTFLFSGTAGIFLINWNRLYAAAANGSLSFWILLAGLLLVSTILPYCTYTAGLKRLTPSTSAVVATVEPLAGTLVGITVFGEPLTFSAFTGMLLILVAVFACREK